VKTTTKTVGRRPVGQCSCSRSLLPPPCKNCQTRAKHADHNRRIAAARRLAPDVTVLRSWFSKYRNRAHSKGLEFALNETEFSALVHQDCHYCGRQPKPTRRNGRVAPVNGIDRVDNMKGYVLGNVVPCCGVCNSTKGTRAIPDLLAHLLCILERSAGRAGLRVRFVDESEGAIPEEQRRSVVADMSRRSFLGLFVTIAASPIVHTSRPVATPPIRFLWSGAISSECRRKLLRGAKPLEWSDLAKRQLDVRSLVEDAYRKVRQLCDELETTTREAEAR
jgi:hypothetical protein